METLGICCWVEWVCRGLVATDIVSEDGVRYIGHWAKRVEFWTTDLVSEGSLRHMLLDWKSLCGTFDNRVVSGRQRLAQATGLKKKKKVCPEFWRAELIREGSGMNTLFGLKDYNNSLWDYHVIVCMCVFIFEAVSRSTDLVRSPIKIGSVVCLCTCVAEYAWNGGYVCHLGHPFLRMYLWWSLLYLVFTCMSGGVAVGDSGLSCCVPCLWSAIISLGLLTQLFSY